MSDAAHMMFTAARRRCYIQHPPIKKTNSPDDDALREQELDDGWDALDEMEGRTPAPRVRKEKQEAEGWKDWMPSGMHPVLEELPKWRLLSDLLVEIEQTMIAHPAPKCERILLLSFGLADTDNS